MNNNMAGLNTDQLLNSYNNSSNVNQVASNNLTSLTAVSNGQYNNLNVGLNSDQLNVNLGPSLPQNTPNIVTGPHSNTKPANLPGPSSSTSNSYIQSKSSNSGTLPQGLNLNNSSDSGRNNNNNGEVNVEENGSGEENAEQPLRQRRQRTHFTSQQLKVSIENIGVATTMGVATAMIEKIKFYTLLSFQTSVQKLF